MKTTIFTILLINYLTANSQTVCEGTLFDANTGMPVEYANIGIPGRALGTVSDEKGNFRMNLPDSLEDPPIRISRIGYEPFTATRNKLSGQIFLSPSRTTLDEIDIVAGKPEKKVLGNNTKNTFVSAGFRNNSLGAEFATLLKIKAPQTHITSFKINIVKNSFNVNPVFRINLYSSDSLGYPGETILQHNIIAEAGAATGLLEVDLKPYHIYTDKSVFIAIEWVKDLGDARGLYFSSKVGGTTYYRQTSQASWEKLGGIGVGLHAEVSY